LTRHRPSGILNPVVTGINHVQISVPSGSEHDVRRFYGGVLGLAEIPLPTSMTGAKLIWFDIGSGSTLHVGFEDGINRLATRAHVAYQVLDIAGWRRRMTAAGLELIDQPVVEGYDRFHFVDPFGNRVEMIGAV
jgi:catechol 2,3-dioxygenase-like lactoylglutathione lyase family enzyme